MGAEAHRQQLISTVLRLEPLKERTIDQPCLDRKATRPRKLSNQRGVQVQVQERAVVRALRIRTDTLHLKGAIKHESVDAIAAGRLIDVHDNVVTVERKSSALDAIREGEQQGITCAIAPQPLHTRGHQDVHRRGPQTRLRAETQHVVAERGIDLRLGTRRTVTQRRDASRNTGVVAGVHRGMVSRSSSRNGRAGAKCDRGAPRRFGMANPSVQKREKERARQDKQKEKDAKRQQRRETAPARDRADGIDPDLVGIIAGPQPIPEDD